MGTRRGLLYGWLGVLGFSGSLVATRFAVRELDPSFVGLGRAMAGAVLAAVVLRWRRAPLPSRAQVPRLLAVALGVVVGFPWLISLAMRTMPAAHGAVIVGLLPMATSVLAVIRAGERPSLGFWMASVAGLVGVLAFAVTRGAGGLDRADLLALGAVILGGLGYCEGGLLAREMPPAHVICWALILASPFLAVATTVTALRAGVSAGPVAWLGVFYRGMAEAGIARVSQIQLAQPVLTLLWSALLLGERVDPATIAAALFIVGCVLVTLKTRVRTVGAIPEAP